jgi:uncharacterized membrane protein
MKQKLQYFLLLVMIINSSYLSYKYCKFYYGNKLLESFDCADGCDSVMMSSYSLIFGIPVPLYGLFYFLGLTILFTLHTKKNLSKRIVGLYLAPGLGFAIYCLYVLYFVLQLNCKFCLLSHGSLLVFAVSLLGLSRNRF